MKHLYIYIYPFGSEQHWLHTTKVARNFACAPRALVARAQSLGCAESALDCFD